MADTGQRSPTTNSGFGIGGASSHDENTATSGATFGIGTSKTLTVGGPAGDDLPEGATVNGVKVFITGRHIIFSSYEAAAFTSVKLSLNGGSNYSNNILSSNQNTTTSNVVYDFGGDSETWGLSWSGFTDISDLKVEMIVNTADGAGNHFTAIAEVFVQVYYTEGGGGEEDAPTIGSVKLNGAKIQIVSGKFLIE